jgi:hypothetical protein
VERVLLYRRSRHDRGAGEGERRQRDTTDAARARDFYCKVFNVEPKKMEGGEIEYWTFHKGPKTVGGCMKMTEHMTGMPSRMSRCSIRRAPRSA